LKTTSFLGEGLQPSSPFRQPLEWARRTLSDNPLLFHDWTRHRYDAKRWLGLFAMTAPFVVGVIVWRTIMDDANALSCMTSKGPSTPWAIVATIGLMLMVPVALGVGRLLPWLQSSAFDELLLTNLTRASVTRGLWVSLWVQSLTVFYPLQLGAMGVWLIADPACDLGDFLRRQGVLAVLAPFPLAIASSHVVWQSLAARNVRRVVSRGILWMALGYPLQFGYALVLFFLALFCVCAPIISLVWFILEQFVPEGFMTKSLCGMFVASLATYGVILSFITVRGNLGRGESCCVPQDWLDVS